MTFEVSTDGPGNAPDDDPETPAFPSSQPRPSTNHTRSWNACLSPSSTRMIRVAFVSPWANSSVHIDQRHTRKRRLIFFTHQPSHQHYNMSTFQFTIPKNRELLGGDLVAQSLSHLGVDLLFGLHGGHLDQFLVAAAGLGIRLVDTRHETVAVQAAESYAKLSGKLGVAFVTANSG